MPYNPDEHPLTGISAAVRGHEQEMLAIDGVEGIAAGQDRDGNDAIVIYAREQSIAERVPETIDDYPIEVVVTGKISAY